MIIIDNLGYQEDVIVYCSNSLQTCFTFQHLIRTLQAEPVLSEGRGQAAV